MPICATRDSGWTEKPKFRQENSLSFYNETEVSYGDKTRSTVLHIDGTQQSSAYRVRRAASATLPWSLYVSAVTELKRRRQSGIVLLNLVFIAMISDTSFGGGTDGVTRLTRYTVPNLTQNLRHRICWSPLPFCASDYDNHSILLHMRQIRTKLNVLCEPN